MIKNIWINIPGFSKYEINRESRQIRSYCRGVEPRILKPCNIQEEYLNAIQFCAIVLQAYRTGDFSMVITEIESRKAKVTEYIIRHRIAVQPERVREVWEAVLDVALNCIIEKRTYIVNLTGYLNSIARSYAAQKKKLEKITVSLDAGFYSLQKYQ